MPWQRKATAPLIVVTDASWWSVILTRFPWLQYLAPGLAGEIVDVTSFCAAGPEWTPPITMDDIVWIGWAEDPLRPHHLLTVTRAIARQEAFAAYCENPDEAAAQWRTYDVNPLYVQREAEVWNSIMYHGTIFLPAGTTFVRVTQLSGLNQQMYWGLADPALNEAVGYDDQPAVWKTGLGGTQMNVGSYTQYDFSTALVDHPSATPHLTARDGYLAPPSNQFSVHIQYYAPGSADYDPGEAVEDPDVELPDGTGSTVDQLETKLDLIQQLLAELVRPNFGLDLTTTIGPAESIGGDLVDAVGLLLTVIDRPDWVSEWVGDPPRFPHIAYLTFGNADGWWSAQEVEHENSVYMPLPAGATKFSVVCRGPMRATATFYRPIAGPA